MTQSLIVHLPNDLYVRIKKRADEARRSVESEAIELLASNFPANGYAQTDPNRLVASLKLLDTTALERAARSRLAIELASELESLHLKKQREGLTEMEAVRCSELVSAYEQSMLVRAEAISLLKKRGVDISPLADTP